MEVYVLYDPLHELTLGVLTDYAAAQTYALAAERITGNGIDVECWELDAPMPLLGLRPHIPKSLWRLQVEETTRQIRELVEVEKRHGGDA